MKSVLIAVGFWIAQGNVVAAQPELVLAGGGVRICSSLAINACVEGTTFTVAARQNASSYQFSEPAIAAATDADLWISSPPAVGKLVEVLVRDAATHFKSRRFKSEALSNWFATRCAVIGETTLAMHACRGKARAAWEALLDDEQSALIAALELPDLGADGERRREAVRLDATAVAAGPNIWRAFVAAAARRSKGKPRIAFVTAASADGFASVDFYRAALAAAGADTVWWPIDAASAAVVNANGDCNALEAARRRELQLPNRDRVYPDLAAEQARACTDRTAFFDLPNRVDGVFFGGGDQWRLRRAFFDANDRPNAALTAIRAAFARGSLAVGGTSAGMAVQSDRSMLTSGERDAALSRPSHIAPPPSFGCQRAGRCPKNIGADDLTVWRGGGFGLVPGMMFDTHFSERGRDARLIRALAESSTAFGIGADENTAVRLLQSGPDSWQIDAIGANQVWIFERAEQRDRLGKTKISARAHRLRDGERLVVSGTRLRGGDESAPQGKAVSYLLVIESGPRDSEK